MVTEPVYDPCGGHLSLDFTNTTGRGPAGAVNERLVDYGSLLRWAVAAELLTHGGAAELRALAAAHPRQAAAVLARALALREALFRVWHAQVNAEPTPDGALGELNREVVEAAAHARLVAAEGGLAWTWEPSPGALDAPLWPIARSAADLLVSPERALVRECAAATCLWLFLDRTRNHGRRWCDMKSCGNREKVREHRRRRGSRPIQRPGPSSSRLADGDPPGR